MSAVVAVSCCYFSLSLVLADVQPRWKLDLHGGSVARLSIPSGVPAGHRVEIGERRPGPSWHIQLSLFAYSVEANRTYSLRFRAKADQPRRIGVGVGQAHSEYKNLGFYRDVELTREWKENSFQVTLENGDKNARVHFDLNDSDKGVEIAEVQFDAPLSEAERKPEARSPKVESMPPPAPQQGVALRSWQLLAQEGCAGRLVPSPSTAGAQRVEIDKAGAQAWHLRAHAAPLQLNKGQAYSLTFRARADKPRPLFAEIQQTAPPWNVLGLGQEVALTESWKEYSLELVANASDANASLNFHLARQPIAVEFNDVVLKPIDSLKQVSEGNHDHSPSMVRSASPAIPPPYSAWSLLSTYGSAGELLWRGEKEAVVRIAIAKTPNQAPQHLQLVVPLRAVAKGETYRVRCKLRADGPRKVILAIIDDQVPPKKLGFEKVVDVKPDWVSLDRLFTAVDNARSASLRFGLGTSDEDVEIADLRVTRGADDLLATPIEHADQ